MNLVITVDLTEIITMNPEVYPCPTVKELLESFCDEPFLFDTKLEELLPRFKWYADDNFGCQIEFHTLCTIKGHTSLQLTIRHFLGRVEAEITFSIVRTEGLVNLLKETIKVVAAQLPLPYPVCKQCNQQHKHLKCPWAAQWSSGNCRSKEFSTRVSSF